MLKLLGEIFFLLIVHFRYPQNSNNIGIFFFSFENSHIKIQDLKKNEKDKITRFSRLADFEYGNFSSF